MNKQAQQLLKEGLDKQAQPEDSEDEREASLPIWMRGSRYNRPPEEYGSMNIPEWARVLPGVGIGGAAGAGAGALAALPLAKALGDSDLTLALGALLGAPVGAAAGGWLSPKVMPQHLYEYERHKPKV